MSEAELTALKIERDWAEVIERRADELRSGKVKGVPADEVVRKLKIIVDSEPPSRRRTL
jgi:hypothetical protein